MSRLAATAGDLIYQLKRGLAYRSIKHSQMRVFSTWLPLILAMFPVMVFSVLPEMPQIFGDKALLDNSLTFLATLPGFYFAGLAAVATFGGAGMDQVMSAPAPKIRLRVGGQWREDELTRRLFLSYLFSYLVILSFAICIAIILVSAAEGSVHAFKTHILAVWGLGWAWHWIKVVFLFLLFLPIASLIVTTLHGIYFLTERMHQP